MCQHSDLNNVILSVVKREREHVNVTDLILHSDFSGQRVIRVPLLVEAQAQLLHLVFGLQAPCSFPCVCVTGAGCVELLTGRRSVSTTELITRDGLTFIREDPERKNRDQEGRKCQNKPSEA